MADYVDRCPDCGSGDFAGGEDPDKFECYVCGMERTKRERKALKLVRDMLEDILDRAVKQIIQKFPEPNRNSISSLVIERAKTFIAEGEKK